LKQISVMSKETKVNRDGSGRVNIIETGERVDLSRRALIFGGAGLIASAAFPGCRSSTPPESDIPRTRNIGIDGRDYRGTPPQGQAREFMIEARPAEVEIASGRVVTAWTYNGRLPGTELRASQGERLRIHVRNGLTESTSVHWHGIPQSGTNNMDGVPGVTQEPIKPGEVFIYDFVASEPGSYMFHSHSGLQLDRGLFAPLIIEPRQETLQYDREYVLCFDDWLDGSPDEAYAKLKRGEMQGQNSMPGMTGGEMGGTNGVETEGTSGGGKSGAGSQAVQMEEGADVPYQTFLVNGRAPGSPAEFETRRGERVRLRFINPSGSTMYRIAVGGHKMTVTHADGFPVEPVEVDTLEISMGERYDVIINADNPGIWAIVAISTDEPERGARALLRYQDAHGRQAPPINAKPDELRGRLLNYTQLVALEGEPIAAREPDRRIEARLGGQMVPYEWAINGKLYPAESFEIRAGERVRVSMVNESMMRHPMHLHGHSFRLLPPRGVPVTSTLPPFKDTAYVEANGGKLDFEFTADNPGDWLFHCHHAYHMEAGMARVFKYV